MDRLTVSEAREELGRVLTQIDQQMQVISLSAYDMGVSPESVRNPDGTYAMTPLIIAKAQALSALVLLRNRPTVVNLTPPKREER